MYLFPRQFGLHNVFTSTVDPKTTVQKFQDYTIRDEEIASHLRSDRKFIEQGLPKIPKRLRGAGQDLVRRLQIQHRRCSYFELIRHYCPSILDSLRDRSRRNKLLTSVPKTAQSQAPDGKSSKGSPSTARRATQTQNRTQGSRVFQIDPSIPIVDLAAPVAHVSAFLQAALSKLIPDAFFGEGNELIHNKELLAKKMHHFISLRRFETMSLHELSQGFKTSNLQWLQLPGYNGQKHSQQEALKQLEIFHELLYYIFDSLVIPLARNTFYVTESNNHRYQVFYFRQDVWKMVSERAMCAIKDGMLEELKVGDIQRTIDSRRLGFSQIRLLPKGAALRSITNLRRRFPSKHNNKILGPSINTILAPIHNVLKLEKHLNPSNLGATLFSVGDIYKRLKEFRSQLPTPLPRLYFVKADVQSAFDTIPQEAVLKLMTAIPSQANYKVFKHAEVRAGERSLTGTSTAIHDDNGTAAKTPPKPSRRWNWTAYPSDESRPFLQRLDGHSSGHSSVAAAARQRKNTVFVNSAAQSRHDTRGLLRLLAEHVTDNHIKVGKKLYRQRRGIPQGSVLSSYLCNYFYADLEAKHLGFLREDSSSVLLRLIDDFLLITTDKRKAQRFAAVLHRGVPEYGVQVSSKKSLANFAVSVAARSGDGDGQQQQQQPVQIATVDSGADFPYCGVLINCRTLAVRKDVQRDQQIDVFNTLTVEHSRAPGQNFERKVLHTFKIQSHLMFYDTSHNSRATVFKTLRAAFRQTALKMWAYMRALGRASRPRPDVVKLTIMRTAEASYLILTNRFRKLKNQGYECDIRKSQVARLAYEAFEEILSTKQTQHVEVVSWLRGQIAKCNDSSV
ncbi:Telomerase ribonucleoprotein complex - RNA-binding domain protein [Akanthomyces lecanii RCEF 1005]|uniref:Telomerase reverse transcriptase n=1 Tax=Akanthomyces lecanii RCEF 1005 TaxID=1081108 RepID=A0A162KPD8_CORDF|nr:Telomerase ribonucleoprotein complex - RNA-binding domain protein [Akanthomyces lecanii RCEF 1005]